MSEEYYSAEQVIGLAAWGNTEMPSDLEESLVRERIEKKWGKQILQNEHIEKIGGERRHPCVLAMRRTLLRCLWRERRGQISAGRWSHLSPGLAETRAQAARHALRRADARGRKWTRIIVRLSGKIMAEVMADLRSDLRPLYKLRGKRFEQITEAILRINSDLGTGKIRLQGRMVRQGQDAPKGEYEQVPALYFEPKWRTISLDNKAGCDNSAPLQAQRGTQHEWWNLRFSADDVDRLYRPVTVGDQGVAGSAPSRMVRYAASTQKERVTTLKDLPADWTLNQTIAWIMFRDTSLVKSVAGVGVVRFATLLALAEFDAPPRGVPDRWSAEEELVVRLCAGDLRSKGQIAGKDEVQVMEPLDWTQGKLGEERDHVVLRHLRFSKKFWFDITLPKAAIISIWPLIQPNVTPHGVPPPESRNPAGNDAGLTFADPFDHAERRVWESDPANEVVQDKIWLLQPAITREITQTENDAIPRLLATSSSEARDSELRRLWRWLAVLKTDERKLLSAGRDEIHSVVDRLWESYGHLVSPPGLPSRLEVRPPVPGPPVNAAGLPSDAWIRATEAFAWLAFGDASKCTDFDTRLRASPDIEQDLVLQNDMRRLGDACDAILQKARAEKCFAYVQVAGTIDMKPLPSWLFRHGITVNIFHGVVDRSHADLDAGSEISSILRKTGCSGEVWFRRNELINAMGAGQGSAAIVETHLSKVSGVNVGIASAIAVNNDLPQGELEADSAFRNATKKEIHGAISAVYDLAESHRMKPPNLKEIAPPVLARLKAIKVTATVTRVMDLAGDATHRNRRRRQGARVNRSLPPFSDPEM